MVSSATMPVDIEKATIDTSLEDGRAPSSALWAMKNMRVNWFGSGASHGETAEPVVVPKWLLFAVFAVLYGPFVFGYGWDYRHIANADLPSFYSAAVQVFEYGASPYDHEGLQAIMGPETKVHPYLYPPPSLLFFRFLPAMDYDTARQVVLWFNHAIIFALLWAIPLFLLRGTLHRGFSLTFLFMLVYGLGFYPTVVTLFHGQVNFLLLAFLLAFWFLDKFRKTGLATLFLALAIFLKTYPIILLPLLFVGGRRKECAYTFGWLGLGSLCSWWALPSEVWSSWLANVVPNAGYMRTPPGLFSPAALWNQGLNGYFARAFTESQWSNPLWVDMDLARNLTYGSAILVALFSAFAAWRSRGDRGDNLGRTLLVALPAIYLVAPFSWEHHLVYLLPSILMLFSVRCRLPRPAMVLFYGTVLGIALLIGLDGWLKFKFHGVVILWALSVFVACSRRVVLPCDTMDPQEGDLAAAS